jgi:quinol monooxygenase YgiN
MKGKVMSVTMHITITTKDGCFDEFHALAKEELAFTRGSKGCVSIQTSSSKDTNTLKFAEVWDSEDDFNTYFAKRVERSGEGFGRLLEGPPEKEFFQTDDWGYGKEWQK